MHKNRVEVIIGGKVHTIVGVESEDHIQKVARYLDKQMGSVLGNETSRSLNSNMQLILTSLNIVNDLFLERKKIESLENEKAGLINQLKAANETIEQYQDELGKIQEETLLLTEKLGEQQLNLTYISQENDRKTEEHTKLLDELKKLRDYNFELKLANETLSKDLDETKQEFDDFISTFDASGNSAKNLRRIK